MGCANTKPANASTSGPAPEPKPTAAAPAAASAPAQSTSAPAPAAAAPPPQSSTTAPAKAEDDMADEADEAAKIAMMRGRTRRTGVSAEADKEDDEDFEVPVHEKDDDVKEKLKEMVLKNILFSHLDEDSIDELTDAFFEVTHAAGANIITQGEPGDNFYILDDGECDIFVNKGDGPVKVLTAKPPMSFGELALMYSCPRAATVTCLGPTRLWALDRRTFNYILKQNSSDKRELYYSFLSEVPILANLEEAEQGQLCDVLKEASFEDGAQIITQGEEGDSFYILSEGRAIATKDGAEVMKYERGSYFGEMALLKDEPRAATVVAQGKVKVLALDKASFVRLLGPCDEIMQRNMEEYTKAGAGAAAAAPPVARARRAGVSAEADKDDTPYEKKVYEKPAEVRDKLKGLVSDNILFSHLDDAALNEVTDAFFQVSHGDGDNVIKQGDDGDNFYILDDGECDIFVQKMGDAEPKKVLTAKPPMSFGELALMYNCPRAATVTCKGPVSLWALDRKSFNHILRANAVDKREQYCGFLSSCPGAIGKLDESEQGQLADQLAPKSFDDGEKIITEGDERIQHMFIVHDGEVTVTKGGAEVATLTKGMYFGEVSLLNHVPRTATVSAKGKCSCLRLDEASFIRLLRGGACETAMKEHTASYK